MVRGGGEWSAWEKNEEGERKKEENYITKGEKGFLCYKLKFAPPAANLFVGGKN